MKTGFREMNENSLYEQMFNCQKMTVHAKN